MLDQSMQRQSAGCPRCGAGPEKICTHRVGGMERGYVQILRCDSCGYSSHNDLIRRVQEN